MNQPKHDPKIALVGCGAIAENFYLPAIAKHRAATGLVLVDPCAQRVEMLAGEFGAARTALDYQQVLGDVHGAIVAVPPQLHYRIAKDLLGAGVHVLCEKPLTLERAEGEELVALAKEKGVTLSVNNTRRLFPNSKRIKEIVESGEIGPVRSIRYVEGGEFAWPAATGSYFKPVDGQARGVLLDRGAHVLDLLCWWLGAKPRLVESLNDSYGGVECVSHTQFEHQGCDCRVELSWLTKLENQCVVQGERGTVSHSVYDWRSLDVTDAAGKTRKVRLKTDVMSFMDFGSVLIGNFLGLLAGRGRPLVAGAEVLDSIDLINDCYDQATRFEMPWNRVFEPAHA